MPFGLPRGPNDSTIENSSDKPLKLATQGNWGWLWGKDQIPSLPKVLGGIGKLATAAPAFKGAGTNAIGTSSPVAPSAGPGGATGTYVSGATVVEPTSPQASTTAPAAAPSSAAGAQTTARDSPTPSTQGLACEASGLCSLGHVKPFKGDIWPSAGLKASVAARSFKQELILVGETRLVPMFQFYDNLRKLGFGHVLLLTQKPEKCDKSEKVGSCLHDCELHAHMHRWPPMNACMYAAGVRGRAAHTALTAQAACTHLHLSCVCGTRKRPHAVPCLLPG